MKQPQRITTKAVFDLATGTLLEWEGFEYEGPVERCDGGDTATDVGTETTDDGGSEAEAGDELQSGAETATEEEQAEVEAGEEEEAEGDDADWLPEEQLKEFPPEVIAKYAKRYGYTAEEIAADPRLAKALHDKINSDIEIARRAAEQTDEEEQEEQTEEPAEAMPDAKEAFKQFTERAQSFTDQITDPEVAEKFITDFTKAFDIKDPRERAVTATKVLTMGMLNVLRDALPAFLGDGEGRRGLISQLLESQYEGFQDTVRSNSHSRVWAEIVASDPAFESLPAYDTKPNSAWNKAIGEVAELVPGFEDFTIPGKSKLEVFRKKCEIAARLLSGGKTTASVDAANKAVETGRRNAEDSRKRKLLGKLGAGQTKGTIQTRHGSDPLKDKIREHRESDNPFAALNKRS